MGEEDVRIVVLSLTFPEEVLSSAQNIKTAKSDLVLASCDSYMEISIKRKIKEYE